MFAMDALAKLFMLTQILPSFYLGSK